jgi:hypothetical protein
MLPKTGGTETKASTTVRSNNPRKSGRSRRRAGDIGDKGILACLKKEKPGIHLPLKRACLARGGKGMRGEEGCF